MTHVLLDTHAWAWSFLRSARLSPAARVAIERAEAIFVSPISLYEIAQKARLGKWPEMVSFLEWLPHTERHGARYAVLTPAILRDAAEIDWSHRDPFDRIIGQTAIAMNLPLISTDTAFDALVDTARWPGRIW